MSNAMQFFSSILLEEGKNGTIEGKKSEFILLPGTLHATASTGVTSTGEEAEQRGNMELYDAQRDTLGVHGSKITKVARLCQHLIDLVLFAITFI